MKNVLIDNWFLENIAFKYNDQLQLFSSQEFLNILEAILLWDNVYYPENEYSHFWQYLIGDTDLRNYITGCGYTDEFSNIAQEVYNGKIFTGYSRNTVCGAIEYSLLAAEKGFDYLPCSQRSRFIKNENLTRNLFNIIGDQNLIKKNKYFDLLDESIKEYYKDFNKSIKENVYEMKFPVFTKYILKAKPSDISFYEFVSNLKKRLCVKEYLKYIENIEKEMEQGKFINCQRFKNDINELVDEITKKNPELIMAVKGQMKPEFNINYNLLNIRKLHFCFIKEIIKEVI